MMLFGHNIHHHCLDYCIENSGIDCVRKFKEHKYIILLIILVLKFSKTIKLFLRIDGISIWVIEIHVVRLVVSVIIVIHFSEFCTPIKFELFFKYKLQINSYEFENVYANWFRCID